MEQQTTLLYDGSFDGFLCCIYMIYDEKIKNPFIRKESEKSQQLFENIEYVITEKQKSKRVWQGFILKTTRKQQLDIFKTFLSEIKGVENTLFKYIQTVFNDNAKYLTDYGNKDILKISQVAKMVGREKHRMEAFVRFILTKDNIYIATVTPDFNVLPLIIPHFKDRYADQKWVIYDVKRNYGIFYDLKTVETITMDYFSKLNHSISKEAYADEENSFQELWYTYYKNVNITSRKNKKLHHQHLPKRYWKYLTEKRKDL